jgi:myo-inositol 2-dehydrogenase/D-chiro-inositol 1-dehydrogenase
MRMPLRIGVIGVGAIGKDHAHRCGKVLPGSEVTALSDVDEASVRKFIEEERLDASFFTDGHALIKSPKVDAVLVTCWGAKHEEFVLSAIAEGKPVFCEKPLAETASACLNIVEAETARGKRLVQVGFMRPFDRGYQALKKTLDDGTIGTPLMVNCRHFNYDNVPYYKTQMAINDTLIHELDVLRWLLDDDYLTAQAFFPRRSSNAPESVRDPQVVILRTVKGIHINAEIYVFSKFAYDVQCEVIGENGIASLPEPMSVPIRRSARDERALLTDWKARFIDAYDVELQTFINNAQSGHFTAGASAWDGFAAAVAADACIKSQATLAAEPVDMPPRPAFYKQ